MPLTSRMSLKSLGYRQQPSRMLFVPPLAYVPLTCFSCVAFNNIVPGHRRRQCVCDLRCSSNLWQRSDCTECLLEKSQMGRGWLTQPSRCCDCPCIGWVPQAYVVLPQRRSKANTRLQAILFGPRILCLSLMMVIWTGCTRGLVHTMALNTRVSRDPTGCSIPLMRFPRCRNTSFGFA